MSMHNPELYAKYNTFQKKGGFLVLQDYKEDINRKSNASVIDLGCGDGFVTSTMLKPIIAEDFKEVIGVDVSEEMLKYASEVYRDDKTNFVKMDVVGDIPEDFKGRFDIVFSNSVFQFITDQEKAFKNVYELLSKGGICVLNMTVTSPVSQLMYDLVSKEKWRAVKQNVEQTFVKLFATEEPELVLQDIMKKTGFKEYIVRKEKTFYDYDRFDKFRKMVEAGNFAKLPDNRLQEFLDEFMEMFKEIPTVERLSKTSEAFRFHYYRLTVFGKK